MRLFWLYALSTALLVSQLAYAPPHPTWWATRGVLAPNSNPDDHAAVNQGQLKNMARATFDEMQASLPGGAGTALTALLDSWETPTASTDDFLPVNQGQLKALAAPFYQRLEAVRASLAPDWPVVHFPWAQPGQPAVAAADPLALANIGQVKNLFARLDGNRHQHGDLSDPSANPADYQFGIAWLKDSTGSGTPDYQAIELDTSLLIYEFTLVSGGGQTVAPNAVSADPIIVKLLHQNAPAANVAVTLSTGGSAVTHGALGSSSAGPWQSELTLLTNTQGQVQVWWQAPNQPSHQASVTASTIGATTPLVIPVATGTGGSGGPGNPGNPGTVQPPVMPMIQAEWRVKWMTPMSNFFDGSGTYSWAEIFNFFGSHHLIEHPENDPPEYYSEFSASGSYSSPTSTPYSNWRFLDYLYEVGEGGWFWLNWNYLQGLGFLMVNPQEITVFPGPRCKETAFVPTTNQLGHVTGWTSLPEIEWQQIRFRLASLGNQAVEKTWLVIRHDEWMEGSLPTGQIDPSDASFGPMALQSQTCLAGVLKVKVSAGAAVPQIQFDRVINILQPTDETELYLDPETGALTLQPKISPNLTAAQYKLARFRLLPIYIKVHQTQDGPQGSDPKYDNAPEAYVASNLFSVWPNEEAIVKVKLPPPFDQPQNLPPNLIKWEVPGHTIPDNTLEAPLSWTLGFGNNTKEVKITIGGSEFKLHFKVQGVGIISEVEAAALVPHAAVVMLAYRQEAIDFGTTYPAGPQDDAMRHAYWCSVSVSTFPVTAGDVDLIATGHEHTNRYVDQQQAFNGTMDLKNNAVGMTVNHQVNGLPDRAAIRTELEQRYNAGDMYIWEVPRGAASRLQQDSEGILIKSNGSRIH